MVSTLTGYGPRHRLVFDGDGEKFEVWEAKFRGYLLTKELDVVLIETSPDASKNKQVYAELIQLLDDRSIALIFRDAVDQGKEALEILRNYYLGSSKPRVISLYKKLSTLQLSGDEQLVDYIIRAEAVAAALKKAGEVVSESMIMAMVLSGLPPTYDTFSTVVEQWEKEITFQEFKKALMNYEESGKLRSSREEENVMNASQFVAKCYECLKPCHKFYQCPQRVNQQNQRWCSQCKSNNHNTHQCRRKNAITTNTVSSEGDQAQAVGRGDSDEGDDTHNFAFQTSSHSRSNKDNKMSATEATPSTSPSARVIQLQNKRTPLSPEKPPARKRLRRERIVMEEEEEEETANEENTSPTTTTTIPVLSTYEQMVQLNIAKRQSLLESMGILKAKEEIISLQKLEKKKPVYRGIIIEKKNTEPVVCRRSLRQQQVALSGKRTSIVTSHEDEPSRPPPGPAPLLDYYQGPDKEEYEAMLKKLTNCISTSSTLSSTQVWEGTTESVVKRMKEMQVKEEWVVKVVPDRIISVQFHPSVEKTLVLVGGKWGQLGVLDVGRDDEGSSVYCFHPHSRPINCLSVAETSPHIVYSTSYDGSFRQTDLEAGMVQEVYSLKDEHCKNFLSWHSQQDTHNFLLSASQGRVFQVDTRVSDGKVKRYLVHERKTVKVITTHPHHHHYYATGSNDGCVCLWDLRRHKKNKPLDTAVHARTVNGLEFSHSGNVLISTSMDDHLRFITCDKTVLRVKRKIKHDNQTSNTLTTFKARFVPTRDDLVYVGSTMTPRRMEVWGSDGLLHHDFQDPLVTSVNSVVAFHPFHFALAGCNATGRAQVFM